MPDFFLLEIPGFKKSSFKETIYYHDLTLQSVIRILISKMADMFHGGIPLAAFSKPAFGVAQLFVVFAKRPLYCKKTKFPPPKKMV